MRDWTEAELRQKLSARQYEVLALVTQHLSSKEIGARLGLSYKTIDNHVADMMVRLDVSSRADAARIFLGVSEARERLPSTSESLDGTGPGAPQGSRPVTAAMHEEVAVHPSSHRTTTSSLLKLPPVGGARHDLGLVQRVAAMGQVGLASVVLLAAIVTVMVGILSLLGR